LFYDGVAFAEEHQHVAAEEEDLGERAEDGKRGGDAEEVFHLGGAGGEGAEVVVGLHGTEDALDHGCLEVSWRLYGSVFAGEVLPDAEVFCSPSDALVEFGEAGGDAADGHGLFAGVDVCDEMDFDAAGEVETTVDGRVDDRDFFEPDHRRLDLSCVRVNVWLDEFGRRLFVRMIV
jgi:hypothetical protein